MKYMSKIKCKLLQDYKAKKPMGSGVIHKLYRKNKIILGQPVNVSMTPDHQLMALETTEGFLVPEIYIDILTPTPNYKRPPAPIYEEANEVIDKTPSLKSIFKKPKTLKYLNATEIVDNTKIKSKTTIQFAIGGMIIGIAYALLRSKNKLILGALGGFAGGTIGNFYTNATNKEI
jgi:hypothetical protein